MKQFYWYCPTCGEVDKVVIQFLRATPYVLEDAEAELQEAESAARKQVNHQHKINFVQERD